MVKSESKEFRLTGAAIEDVLWTSPLNTPIEGFPRELRYRVRIWRMRIGHFSHLVIGTSLCIAGHDLANPLEVAAVAVGVSQFGLLGAGVLRVGRPFESRRLKRMYFPIGNKSSD